MDGVRHRSRPKKTWSEVIEKDCPTYRYSRKMLQTLGNGEKFKLICCIIVRTTVCVNGCFSGTSSPRSSMIKDRLLHVDTTLY